MSCVILLFFIIIQVNINAYPLPSEYHHQLLDSIPISGTIVDEDNIGLPGVTITVEGLSGGVISDIDGKYSIPAPSDGILKFSFIGMETQVVPVNAQRRIDIVMLSKLEELEGVTVVAFGKQKKESVLASVTTINPSELRVPSSNLTTAMAGRMSGIISYQRSGEPGQDNAEFFIRGVTTFGYNRSPLILIDGIELSTDDLSRMHPDDIASFSIMKDATATSLYGARGANGVILVTTKSGVEGIARINVRFESSMSEPTQRIDFADPLTYMALHNEAIRTRDPLGILPYSQLKTEQTALGANPFVYPANDWFKETIKDRTFNNRINFNLSGGGKVARYYISASATKDNGALKVDQRNNFNSNIDLQKYIVRSNVDINLTESTVATIRIHGTFDDYQGPINGGTQVYRNVARSNPVLFPAYYEPDEANQFRQHILYGNSGTGRFMNPYADLTRGYKEYSNSLMLAQFQIEQDLGSLVEGLNLRGMANTYREAFFDITRTAVPFYYEINKYNSRTDSYSLKPLNSDQGREYLDYVPGNKTLLSNFYGEMAINYNRVFNDKHGVSGLLVGIARQSLFAPDFDSDLQTSLPKRNVGVSGRFTYSYDNKYFSEFNFGYNGTERFSENERFGFFPSYGVGWLVSNEDFWEPLSPIVNKLKLRATFGLVGNDAIGREEDRFFYLSNVNLNNESRGYRWGTDGLIYEPGVSISRYANDLITWETAEKLNLGFELGLFNSITIIGDIFSEKRDNILMDRINLSTLGLQAQTRANVGAASSSGIDLSMDIEHFFNNDYWVIARTNFTYARGVFDRFEEPNYQATPWLSRLGAPITQQWGYIAERLFVDDEEVAQSPDQLFGSVVRGGDIKYRDINGDDKITGLDQVPIGYPTTPEIIYGFGFSAGYKNVDLSMFFQGSANSSFWIDPTFISPFIDATYSDETKNWIGYNALIQDIADSYWSESNRDVYAFWPRLSDNQEANNVQRNTWFMQDGSFLRLKSIEAGFSLPRKMVDRLKTKEIRFYLSGTNLLHWSKFKLWDPEMGGNGLDYPVQRVFNFGAQISF
ncbi:TonB-dependent receptor [Membranihabitans marinus]